ncbi:MAG: polysaccharide deacetylase [Desulfosporosinus sp.]|nr:polysaccharide deacetylase [Desulfosporosinus sp.]
MSKKKIIGGLIFMVCFISSSIFWVGANPQWSMAAQSVFQRYNPPMLNEALIPLPNKMVLLPWSRVSDRGEAPSTTVKEAATTTFPGSVQSDQISNPKISDQEKDDWELAATPSTGSPDTPIHSYYDQLGNPPTAPGLAMRQRNFQLENGKMAYLTFDDGPYPSTTPKILAILAKETIPATFFDIGYQVELYPDLLKAEYEQGNAIGNHTYSHNMATLYKSPQAFLADVKKSEEIIYQTLGIRPQIVRAPGGTVDNFKVSYFNTMDAAGYLMEDWNVDSGDTNAHLVPVKTLIQHVEQQIQGKTRVVILLHDLVGKTTTIEALPEIIDVLKKQGFSFGELGPHVLPIVFPEGLHN